MADKNDAIKAAKLAMLRTKHQGQLPAYMGIYDNGWIYDTDDGRKWVRIPSGDDFIPQACSLIGIYPADDYRQPVVIEMAPEGYWVIARLRIEGYTSYTPHPEILARIYNSANISIPNNANTTLTFDSEEVDTSGFHSLVTNTNRLTVPAYGSYTVLLSVEWQASGSGRLEISIRLNGTTVAKNTLAAGGIIQRMQCTYIDLLSAGDYVDCYAYQNSGGAININASSGISPYFTIRL